MDFAMLPPEINSGRLYAGAGAAPLLAAAAAWGGLASELASAAAEHTSVVTGLAAAWMGPSATAMAASAMTYTSWLTSTAEMATQTAAAASSAAAAFEAAFAATVPPPLIAANRAQLMALVATNFLGINTAAIMATEAQYAEMWAQDVSAMFGYQAQSAAATSALPQFPILSWLTTPNSFLTALSNPATPLGFLEQQWLSQASSGPYQVLSYPLLMALMAQANGYMNRSNDLTAEGNSISDRLAQDDEQQLGHPSPVNPAESPTMPGNSPKVAERPEAVMGNARTAGALTVPPNWDKATQQVELASKATPLPASGGMGGMIPTPIAAVNAPERKQRNGNEVLVRVKFVPTSI